MAQQSANYQSRDSSVPARIGRARKPRNEFLAVVTCTGHLGQAAEPPKLGPQYWFSKIRITNNTGDVLAGEAIAGPTKTDPEDSTQTVPAAASETDAEGFTPAESGWLYGLFTNLPEINPELPNGGTHLLAVGQIVLIKQIGSGDSAQYYAEAC